MFLFLNLLDSADIDFLVGPVSLVGSVFRLGLGICRFDSRVWHIFHQLLVKGKHLVMVNRLG